MTTSHPALLRAIRGKLDLTQEELAERLGVSFATVNRWEGGLNAPQKAAREAIERLAVEAGVSREEAPLYALEAAALVTGRRSRKQRDANAATKSMEQMLWDAACSLSSTVGSEAWNSRDLKSRPH